jgi:signal transduction histidine kinase
MRGSIDHLVRLIGDLTDATAIEGGRCALRLREIDLGSLVAEVTEQELWRRVRLHPPGRRLIVRGDPDRLQQVLENLMSNALKYGEAATPIDVTVEPSGANARVSVSNRGRGIPPTEIDAVFERYMRTREACSSKVNGSGLGLHIARGLVEAHGGRIWVESVVDDVTTFHFTIPLVRV